MDSSDYYDHLPVDSHDDVKLHINDMNKPDSSLATFFCDGKYSEDTRGEVRVKCVMCKKWTHSDSAEAERASYVCNICKYFFAL